MIKETYFTKSSINNESKLILQNIEIKKHKPSFIVEKSALIVLDMQEYFLNSTSHAFVPSSEAIINNINTLITFFNNKKRPVIFTKHINTQDNSALMSKWWDDIITSGNILSKISDKIDVKQHLVIEKSQYDAFFNTNLKEILQQNNIEQLVVVGILTHLCCETTIRSAFVNGFESFFVIDGTATYNKKFHEASFYNLSHGFTVPVLTKNIVEV